MRNSSDGISLPEDPRALLELAHEACYFNLPKLQQIVEEKLDETDFLKIGDRVKFRRDFFENFGEEKEKEREKQFHLDDEHLQLLFESYLIPENEAELASFSEYIQRQPPSFKWDPQRAPQQFSWVSDRLKLKSRWIQSYHLNSKATTIKKNKY